METFKEALDTDVIINGRCLKESLKRVQDIGVIESIQTRSLTIVIQQGREI